MNLEQRYRCPAHPDTTIGAYPGQTEPPTCKRLMCGKTMELVTPPASEPAPTRPRRQVADPRQAHTQRRESKPQ